MEIADSVVNFCGSRFWWCVYASGEVCPYLKSFFSREAFSRCEDVHAKDISELLAAHLVDLIVGLPDSFLCLD